MLIYIARHAWAGEHGDPNWPDDLHRPLTAEGAERFRAVMAALVTRGFDPQSIATSPYTRCVQTADLIAAGLTNEPPIEERDELTPGAQLGPLLDWSVETGAERVCWVGHNPDVERLASELLRDSTTAPRFPKGSVAAIEFEGSTPSAGEGTLLWHATAKSLGA